MKGMRFIMVILLCLLMCLGIFACGDIGGGGAGTGDSGDTGGEGTPGITVSKTSVTVSEDLTADTFTVAPDTRPADGEVIVVTVISGDTGEAKVSPSILTFTNSSWSARTVTVTGVDDALLDGSITFDITLAVVAASTTANNYDSVTIPAVSCTTTDNDSAAAGIDLVVAIDSVTADGSNVTFSYTATNFGDTDATVGPWIDFFIDRASAPAIGNWGGCYVQLPAADLTAGASVSGEKACSSTANLGTAYAIIDTDGLEAESNEDNNITSGFAWASGGGTSGVDLVVSIDSVTADGSSVTFNYTASNLGETDATVDTWIDFFINRASAPAIGVWGDCGKQLPASDLTAGASFSGTKVCTSAATSGTAYAIIDTDRLEAETNEDNNITSGYAWPSGGGTPGVDLAVTIDSVTSDGSSVTFSYTASNPGDEDATVDTWIDFFIDMASAPAIGDWGNCGKQLPASDLTAGASVSGEKTCTSTATSGTAYAIIDTDGLEAESNADNNITSGFAWASGGGTPGVDLVVQIDGVTADGSSVTFSYTASNLGDTDATVGPWIDLFINSTSAPAIGDWGDCGEQLPVSDLTAGASVSNTKACTSTATSGTAYAIIDTDGLEAESNEDNNITSGFAWASGGGTEGITVSKTSVTVSEDLTTETFTVAPDTQPEAGKLVVVTVTNGDLGEATVNPPTLTFMNSAWSAQTVTVTGVDDLLLDGDITFDITLAIDTIATTANEYDSVTIPAVSCTNTDNDSATTGVDLVVSIDSVMADGYDVTFTYTASNFGDTDATISPYAGLWIDAASAPAVGAPGHCVVSVSAADLTAGAFFTGTKVCPSGATSGTAYAIIDTLESETESNENNNTTSFVWDSGGGGSGTPDLVMTVVPISTVDDIMYFTYTVENIGTGDVGSSELYLEIFYDDPSIVLDPYHPLHEGFYSRTGILVDTASLTAGGSVTATAYCYYTATFAIINGDQRVPEITYNNNTITSLSRITGSGSIPGIDLVVQIDSVTADGSSVTFSYTASNPGDTDATVDTWIDFFIDSRWTPSFGDWGDCAEQILASDLTAGASVSREKACTSTATSGTAYAVIDTDGLEAEINEDNNISSRLAWTLSGSLYAPHADAGPDQNVKTGSLVTLDGSGSSDLDGDDLTYSWSFVSNPGSAVLSDSTAVNPTFTPSVHGIYELSLVVNDGTSDSMKPDSVVIMASSWAGAELIESRTYKASDPQVAFDANGNAFAVWAQDYKIYANRYDAFSGTWSGAEIIKYAREINKTSDPQVAVDANGNAFAVWRQKEGTYYNISASRYDAAAGTWSASVTLSRGEVNAKLPQVAVDANGNAFAVWERQYGSSYHHVYARRYDAQAGEWATLWHIDADTSASASNAYGPQVAVDASGNVFAVWKQDSKIYTNRYDALSGTWSGAVPLSTGVNAKLPQLTVDASGNVFAVWRQHDSTHYSIYANRYDAGAGAWSGAVLIYAGDYDAYYPHVAVDPGGNAFAVWHQSDGMHKNIYASRYDAAAGTWSGAEIIDAVDYDAYYPHVAVDANGNAFAVWHQKDTVLDISDYNTDIYANRYDAGTGAWTGAVIIDAGDYRAWYPRVAVDANGNAFAVWQQKASYGIYYLNDWDIYANRWE
jgi:hypothetical protein